MQSLLDLVVGEPQGAGNGCPAQNHVASHTPSHYIVTEASKQSLIGMSLAFG